MAERPEALKRGPIRSEHIHRWIHGSGWWGRFNAALAVLVTKAVGTMTCAYLFCLIALISLPSVLHSFFASHDPQALVTWLAQTFIQLVLLSVIMVGQRVQQAQADGRADSDHEILSALDAVNRTQLAILQRLDKGGH